MKNKCLICNKIDVALMRTYKASTKVFQGLELLTCNSCSMVFANPMPSDQELDKYNSSYFENAHGGKSDNPTTNAFFSGIAKLRYQFVQGFLAEKKVNVKKVIEIGPGPGYFASHWISRNPQTDYRAIETDSSCHYTLEKSGVKVLKKMDEVKKDFADLVVISHVLEHVSDPFSFLLFATSKLKKGGVLFIEVPCQDWKHKQIDEPHLLFFEKKSIKFLLSKLNFLQIKLTYVGKKIYLLREPSLIRSFIIRVKTKLIYLGIIWPFSRKR